MAKKFYIDIITRHQVYLERLKAGYFKSYDQEIRKAGKAIAEVLQALDVNTLDELTQKSFYNLLKQLREVQLGLYSGQADKLLSNLEELSGEEKDFEVQALKATVNVKGIKAVTKKVAFEEVVKNPIQATGDMLEPFVKDLSGRMISRIEKKIMTGRAQGKTITQMVNEINGTKKNGYQDGVLKTNWNDARTVVRTATQHASSQSRMSVWKANSDIIDGYQWISTLDGKTSQTCRSLDKHVFQLGAGPMPPIHPGCRSTTVPYFKDSAKWDEGATRSAEDGPTDVNDSYYDWLKRQPAAFQNDAIGPTRAKLLRDGGLTSEQFSRLNMGTDFQPLTLDEMRNLNPNAFEKADL